VSTSLELVKRWVVPFIDPKKIAGLAYLPRYFAHWFRYQRLSSGRLSIAQSYPCLSDWVSSTPFDPHYFYQAAWLARAVRDRMPAGKHVDIGSDIRMIAVLSARMPTSRSCRRPRTRWSRCRACMWSSTSGSAATAIRSTSAAASGR
jgi:hypothetical protein